MLWRRLFIASAWTILLAGELGAQDRPRDLRIALLGERVVAVLGGRELRIVDPDAFRDSLEKPTKRLSADQRTVSRILCDPISPDQCIIGRAVGNSDRFIWISVDLSTGNPVAGWPEIPSTNAVLEAVDFGGRSMLWSAGKLATQDTTDLASGVYVSRPGEPLAVARSILKVPDAVGFPHAAFVRIGGQQRIFVRTTGSDGAWMLYDLAGWLISKQGGGAGYVGLGSAAIYLTTPVDVTTDTGRVVAAGSLASVSLEAASRGSWRVRPIYLAGADQPSLEGREAGRPALDPGGSFAFVGSRAIAVTNLGGAKAGLVELCGQGRTLATKAIEVTPQEQVGMGVIGGRGSTGIVTAATRTGYAAQSLLSFESPGVPWSVDPSFADCDSVQPALRRVDSLLASPESTSQGNAAISQVSSTAAEAISKDGARVTYTILSTAARPARVMVRGYGAYGLAVTNYLASPLERAWVAAGNAIIVPVLRGDAGRGQEWIEQGQTDNKERTTEDLIAVALDVRKRGMVQSGRIDLLGVSAGAFSSAKAALRRPDLFDAIVLVSGELDLSILAKNQSPNLQEYGTAVGGFPRWFGAKPAGNGLAPRFLLIHDEIDDRATIEHTKNFSAYLKSLGYHGAGILTKGQGHGVVPNDSVPTVLNFIAGK